MQLLEHTIAQIIGDSELLEYRLQPGEAEMAMKQMKMDGLNKDHLNIINVMTKNRATGRGKGVAADFVKRNFSMKDIFALVDAKYLSFEPSPRNRHVGSSYWLAPKGVVLGAGIRDGQIKAEG